MHRRLPFLVLIAAAVAGAVNSSMLVSTDWLAQHLKDDSLVILHVGAQKDYDAGHIPGAHLVTLADISVTGATGLRLELPPVAGLERTFGRLGVGDGARVVVYAGTDSVQSATRVWFTLDSLGAGERTALLDGGLAAWRNSGGALSTEAAKSEARTLTAHLAQRVATAEWVRAHLEDREVQLLDARLPEFYNGMNAGGMPRAGHIPGARSVPYNSAFGADGKLKTADELRKLVRESPLTVSYCHIGQQATVLYFVARYLGQDARLYDGSFQEWSRSPELPVESAVARKIDAIFSPLADKNSPGAAVLVRSRGGAIFQRGYGIRDTRTRAPIDEHTGFRLASVTKQFTAMAVMLLIHDGKLQLDQKLTGIFPDFPAYGGAIAIRHLLTHTSGLPDYEDLMGPGWSPVHQIQDGDVLELLKHQSAGKFAPGTSWEYSNSGYVMLGLVVAKVSGEPFGEFLRRRIFAPLHMDGTLVYLKGGDSVPNRAYGHSKSAGGFEETDQSSTSATQGDGGVYSNLADLAKWDEALEKHTLLSDAEMSAAVTPVTLANGQPAKWPATPGGDNLAPGKPVSYGFGWFLDPYHSHPRMWHFGSTMGFGTAIERFPADQVSVIVLCNRTDLDAGKLALQVADVMFGQ
ncbi:MAG: serine hydrolase [Candidatus Sulfopaludibacter sp.]|nr:serine hydrolase [Candidatus Sulfopaludibacter sp.]